MGPKAPAYATRLAVSKKKNGSPRTAPGIQHLRAAFNTYGGWGGEVFEKLAESALYRLRAEERAATAGAEWSTLAKRKFLFHCASVAIARAITDALRRSWQQQARANSKRGKPHRATPKA